MQGEAKIHEAARRNGISARILRPFTVIGPFGRSDMAPWKFSEAITKGSKVRLHAGSGRDFTSVQDVATAFVLAAEQPWDGCETYNIGAGDYHTAAELAELLAKELGLPLHAEEAGLPPFMPKETWADSSSASRRIGWRPKVTFPAAVREFAHWYQLNAPHG
jgi:UDP-glucuronate 4-epimerase